MFKKRREKLVDLMPDHSVLCIFSGKAVYSVGDEQYPFSVDRNFYYFTGLDKENMVLMLVKNKGVSEYLFIEPYDAMMAKWIGGRLLPEQAKKISGVQQVLNISNLWDRIHYVCDYLFDREHEINFFCDFTTQFDGQKREAHFFSEELKEKYPYVNVKSGTRMMRQLRLVKDKTEIEKMSQAISVTNEAILNMMRHVKPGMGENELEAYFDFVLKSNKCKCSFPSIVGSGVNSTILHYQENNQIMKDNTLVLCDLGASHEYYCADITRTFPVNGTFTDRQKQIYEIVLEANQRVMEAVKPGITLRDLNNVVITFYEKKLKEIGLLENGKTVSDYYWHGVSHQLGLETHDVCFSNDKLEVGNVFTIEPGLYLEEEAIGVRIEDNVLVTEDGCINLSKDIMKSVEEIENYIQKYQGN